MGDYGLGQPVVVACEGQSTVGVVAGVLQTPMGVLYDVELQAYIHKGLLEEELLPATSDDVRQALEALLSQTVMPGGPQTPEPPGRKEERSQCVRSRFAMCLQEALAHVAGTHDSDVPARFGLGSQVAWQDGSAWRLGSVVGMRSRSDGLAFELDVFGTYVVATEQDLCDIDELPVSSTHALSSRVRYLVPGCESDPHYEATVCAVAGEVPKTTYDIVFDDGDVFEGLGPSELICV
ncbi:MAG: hypothetical protein Q4A01_10630 [Coriobacteriales bacterium]|nr:hypothetical protein [Coriobacteriales bacterium]